MLLADAKVYTVRYGNGVNLEKIIHNGKLYMEQRSGNTWYGKCYDAIHKHLPKLKWYWEFSSMKYTGNVLVRNSSKDLFELRTKAQLSDWLNSLQLSI